VRTWKRNTGDENRTLSNAAESSVGQFVVHRIEQAAAEGPAPAGATGALSCWMSGRISQGEIQPMGTSRRLLANGQN